MGRRIGQISLFIGAAASMLLLFAGGSTAATDLCGAPPNPYGFNFCRASKGFVINNPPSNFCDYFTCNADFPGSSGYIVECHDGTFSGNGGRSDACEDAGGVRRTLFAAVTVATMPRIAQEELPDGVTLAQAGPTTAPGTTSQPTSTPSPSPTVAPVATAAPQASGELGETGLDLTVYGLSALTLIEIGCALILLSGGLRRRRHALR